MTPTDELRRTRRAFNDAPQSPPLADPVKRLLLAAASAGAKTAADAANDDRREADQE